MECNVPTPVTPSWASEEPQTLDGQDMRRRLIAQLLLRNQEVKPKSDAFSTDPRHSSLRETSQPPPVDASRVVFSGVVQLGRCLSSDSNGTGGIAQWDDSTLTVLRDCKESHCPRFAKIDGQCLLHHAQEQDQGQGFF